ncbi:M1 family metallopeptidase [Nitrospira sp. BLG_1]|uniref:M1 family metallopeptidase n=1 Tax=Nitrospira sp. BLG_1 TaxID=3395883 RepID=UPI0039BD380B
MYIRTQALLLYLITLLLVGAVEARAAVSPADHESPLLHHHLSVELIPHTHEITVTDRIELEIEPNRPSLTFTLAPTLQIESIRMGTPSALDTEGMAVSFARMRSGEASREQVTVTLPRDYSRKMTLTWTYRGPLNDPPREPRHLRFVTPSETAGHIGEEGVYLSGETQWYPDLPGSFGTYRMTAQVPQGWTVVASGRKESQVANGGKVSSTWFALDRSEAFTLVANHFVTKSRVWHSGTGQRIDLQTYFLADNAALADEYLDATARYLEAYVRILGDYPFEAFAVVENFFASGLGMPSFTLLGSGSIKRHYVQPYALGHEIVHSWIGNSVFNRDDAGNWVEGLTTYLANYYWHEVVHDDRQALEQRRMMLQSYNLYVQPEEDYAVSQFLRKHDEKDNAIGYQKSAFVFHLLRQEIGEEPFWRGLKTFVREYRNHPADWVAIEKVFSRESDRNLRWFFEQWVHQSGAPVISLGDVRARRLTGESGKEAWQLSVQIQQSEGPFRMAVPIRIIMKESTESRSIKISLSPSSVAEFVLPDQPLRVELDPDLMTFRRLTRRQLPPMLNGYVTDPHKTVLRAFSDVASPLQQIISRIADQELPESKRSMSIVSEESALPQKGSVLALTGEGQPQAVSKLVRDSCGDSVDLRATGFQIDGQAYEGPKMAVLFSCHRTQVPGSVITVLYGVTSGAVEKLSRYLFYYGWHSYVLFQDGVVTKRGMWQGTPDVKEVRVDATS